MKVNIDLTAEEISGRLRELEEEQLRMRCNNSVQQLENTNLLKRGRKEIARLKTILNTKK